MKTINLNGKEISCVLERKSVKNINIRVKSDGVVYISANKTVPEKYILELLEQDKDKIISIIEKIKKNQEKVDDDITSTMYLGEKLPVEIIDDCPERVQFDGKKVVVYTLTPKSNQRIRDIIWNWKFDQCRNIFIDINIEVHKRFIEAGYNVPLSFITVKLMKSRWGSCNVKSGRFSINLRLMDYPIECIYSVFYHEYMHYVHQNHSADFHRDLNKIYPDYEKYDRILNGK